MASTLVTVAVGVLLGTALLGAAFDRRSLLVVAIVAAVPDLDAVASLVVEGATNALLHSLFVPAIAAGAIYWDTRVRSASWLWDRYGWRGVRVAWVAVAVYAVAGIGLDLCSDAGANLLYPVHDRFYSMQGRFLLSTDRGVVQTYATLEGDGLLSVTSPGTTADHHVPSWVTPTREAGLETGVERRLRLVDAGWQVSVVVGALVVAAARLWEAGR